MKGLPAGSHKGDPNSHYDGGIHGNNIRRDNDNNGLPILQTIMFYACFPCLPRRYFIGWLCFLAMFNIYTLRVTLSVAIVAMTTNVTSQYKNGTKFVVEHAEFNWDSKLQGIILSSFFYVYTFMQVPGGYLATHFGGKKVIGTAVLGTGLLTMVTPVAARASPYLLVAVRIVMGFFEASAMPALFELLSRWTPALERSNILMFALNGEIAGIVVGMLLSGIIADLAGWPWIFYAFGIFAIVWCVLWFSMVTDLPSHNPQIGNEELALLNRNLESDYLHCKVSSVPWRRMFTSRPLWALTFAHTAQVWALYTAFTEMPTYLKQVHHYKISSNGVLSAVPFVLLLIVSQLIAMLADYLLSTNRMSTVAVRKTCVTIGFMASIVCLLILAFSTNTPVAVTFLVLSVGFQGFLRAAIFPNTLDISRRYSTISYGFMNTFANFSGILSPLIVGFITKNQTAEEWKIVFLLSAGICVIGLIFYLLFASGEKETWDEHDISYDDHREAEILIKDQ